jgi:hypothetical protein
VLFRSYHYRRAMAHYTSFLPEVKIGARAGLVKLDSDISDKAALKYDIERRGYVKVKEEKESRGSI